MEFIQLTILNWDNVNSQEVKKTPHWFRVNIDIVRSESLFGLSTTVKWVWICLLSEAMRRKSGTFQLNIAYASHYWSLKKNDILEAIELLEKSGTLRVDSESTPSPSGADPALQDKTRQDKQDNIADFFEKFKTHYPKTIAEPGKTLEKFKAVVKSEDLGTRLILATKNYQRWCQVNGKEPAFIKAPTTFLNKVWLDWVNPTVPLDMSENDAHRFGFLREVPNGTP